MTIPKQNYYYIIPAKLAECGDLTKAMLYGLVSSLCNEEGYCWASNKYLGQKLGRKNIGNISLKLNELVKDGYLEITQEKKGNDRKIYLTAEVTLTKNRKGGYEKTEGYPYEKPEDSNISISNKTNTSAEAPRTDKFETNKYPKTDYVKVLNEYQTIKDIKLQGDEFLPPMAEIKRMFKSGRSVNQIIETMGICEDNYDDWAMSTVRMKIADVVGGKLTSKNTTKNKGIVVLGRTIE